MLLLVVGLVVLILVILVVVFLSVRSMRADEDDDYETRTGRPDPAGRGHAFWERSSRRISGDPADSGDGPRRPRSEPLVRRRPAGDGWRPSREAGSGRAGARQPARSPAGRARAGYGSGAAGQAPGVPPVRRAAVPARPAADGPPRRRFASVPRPRGYQRDQALADDRAGEHRELTGRRPPPRSGQAGNGRDGTGDDWPATDWGRVSDEQYWAELSSDKPLATTARTAHGGPAATASGGSPAADGPAERAAFPARRQPAAGMAAAGTPAAPRGTADVPDTDPGMRGLPGWPGTNGDAAGTTSWWPAESPVRAAQDLPPAGWVAQPPPAGDWPGQPEPAGDWPGQPPPAGDWPAEPEPAAAWPGQDGPGEAWHHQDPRTGGWTGSHDRGYAEPGDGHGQQGYWNGSPGTGPATAVPAYDDSYGSGADGWPGAAGAYPSGQLEPLPQPSVPASRATGGWHAAPAPGGDHFRHAEPASGGWDQSSPGYPDTQEYPRRGRHGSYADPGQQGRPGAGHRDWQAAPAHSWPDPQPAHGGPNGYHAPAGLDHPQANSGYEYPPGYPQPGLSAGPATGYGQAAYGQAGPDGPGYGTEGYGRAAGDAGRGHRDRYGQDPGRDYSPGYGTGRG